MAILLLSTGSIPVQAQRLDGCPEKQTPFSGAVFPSVEATEHALQSAGVGLTRDVLLIALRDPRPDIRSLAALKLQALPGKPELDPLWQAWQEEKDTCTKGAIGMALLMVVGNLSWDPAQHPGDQPWITPFQSCTAPSSPLVTLTLKQDTRYPGSAIDITAANQKPAPIPFVWARSPEQLFSVSVTGPDGSPVSVKKELRWNLEPAHYSPGQWGHEPTFVPLLPEEPVHWTWKVSDDFDMSAPGTYHVSFGGRIGYLNTTICSNNAEATVER